MCPLATPPARTRTPGEGGAGGDPRHSRGSGERPQGGKRGSATQRGQAALPRLPSAVGGQIAPGISATPREVHGR
jgi:hypothetical protein